MLAAWLGDARAHAAGCYRLLACRAYGGRRERLHRLWVWSADQSRHCNWHSEREAASSLWWIVSGNGSCRAGRIISPAPDAESDVGA